MIRLGVLGLSEGNGHPYSWSAICNGYCPEVMESCGFPAIPRYLAKQKFPEDAIAGARVTHVWTQERCISEHIASAALIPNVVDRVSEMLGAVDGILLARDDAECHLSLVEPFLRAGIPVYIDKPLAYSIEEAERILALQQYEGQVFTCSAIRYSSAFADKSERFGKVHHLEAETPKSWLKYGVHMIEPVVAMFPQRGCLCSVTGKDIWGIHEVAVEWERLKLVVRAYGAVHARFMVRVYGENGVYDLIPEDTYHSFKAALEHFLVSVKDPDNNIPRCETLEVIKIVERGMSCC